MRASYNSFTPTERMRALRWLKGEYAAGRRHPPLVCDACGQDEGPIEAHSENYAEPFGDHIGEHGLCYRCHQMIHNRFKHPEAWAIYRRYVREGRVFAPCGRNYPAFVRQTLAARGVGVSYRQDVPKRSTLLDDINNKI